MNKSGDGRWSGPRTKCSPSCDAAFLRAKHHDTVLSTGAAVSDGGVVFVATTCAVSPAPVGASGATEAPSEDFTHQQIKPHRAEYR